MNQRTTPPPQLPPPVPGTPPQRNRNPNAKRRRPARGARAGALMMSCAATGGLTYWFAGENSSQAAADALAALPVPAATSPATTAPATTPDTSATTTPEATSGLGTAGSPSTAASAEAAAPAADGTAAVQAFDGDVVRTRFGPMQVQVQLTDGAISDVAVIQYPADHRESVMINSRALPTLRTEALTAQSADVDTVSGATYTSDAYAASLQSAIDAARAAGATQIT